MGVASVGRVGGRGGSGRVCIDIGYGFRGGGFFLFDHAHATDVGVGVEGEFVD
jgi:hypothetical protein